ncbi:helix-turn-helix domain-containing protein [Flavobacterium shii]|nr:helix-turn-helix domain-containing protein [Flavobacterium shii]
MQHLEFEPSPTLQNSIKCFWYTKRDFGEQESSFEVVPDGYAEIIFLFGSTCSISFNGDLQPLPSPFIMGLLNQPVILSAKNCLEIIGIRCFPWTVFDLLGLPSGKDEVHVFQHPIAQLQSTLGAYIHAGKIDDAITYVKEYFLNPESPITIDNKLSKAGVAMRETNGTMPVNQVAAAAHATVRTLERNFKQSSGYSVKDVSGLMRFEQVRNHLWLYPNSSIASLAHELGYTDQSHLSREFKRYSGTTPAAFARKAKKQNRTNDFVVFIQA